MKKKILIILLFSSLARAQFWENPNQKPSLFGMRINRGHLLGNPVGFWLMSEGSGNKVFDLSGNGNGGTFGGHTHWVPGKFGSALDFDGTTDYVEVADPGAGSILDLTAGDCTFIVWVKRDGTNRVEVMLGKKSTLIQFYQVSYWLGFETDPGDVDKVNFFYYTEGALERKLLSVSTITDTNWHQIAVTKRGGLVSIYIDGILDNSGSLTDDAYSNDASVFIGAIDETNASLDGQIDHVLFYNRALIASEIALLYREPFCFMEPNWDMELYGWMTAPALGAGQFIFINMN